MILASQSPRRIELMRETGIPITVAPADIDETPRTGESAAELVRRLAADKARAVARGGAADAGELILAADTVVVLDGTVLGKPKDEDDARRMLRALSGRTHQVMTGVCIADGAGEVRAHFVEVTDVAFYDLTDAEIDEYVASGEPADKAGAYGIQGIGGRLLVRSINGDFYNVVGLPIARVARELRAL